MSSVKEYYAGRSIFVTGATGFIGKVLIEKLLRSCPKLDKIYMLIRNKRGSTSEERIKTITDMPLFDTLKQQQPNAIQEKLKVVHGDVTQLGLGISDENRRLLIENVSIIFHGAASVRFDDTLTSATLMNTRGTREVINLGLEMKKLEVFLHISTTFCNTQCKVIEERLYPISANWEKTIAMVETMDENLLQVCSQKYIEPQPNTYTYTKSLAEHVVYDMCQNKIPAIVFRPSIVISTARDPMAGWIDNFNGPVGLLVASGKGFLRTTFTDRNIKADYMAVDIAVRALILAAWQNGTTTNPEEKLDVSFYNCSNNGIRTISMGQLIDFGDKLAWEVPVHNALWFPGGNVTKSKTIYYLKLIFLHLLPAILVDSLLRIAGQKPILLKIQRRIYIVNMAVEYFITNQWSFLNDKLLNLEKKVLPEEYEEFGYDIDSIDVFEYFKECALQGRKFLLKQDDSTLEYDKLMIYRLYVIDKIFVLFFYSVLYWFLIYKLDILFYLSHNFQAIYEGIMGNVN